MDANEVRQIETKSQSETRRQRQHMRGKSEREKTVKKNPLAVQKKKRHWIN